MQGWIIVRAFIPRTVALLLPLLLGSAALAEEPTAACTAPVAPTGELAPWSSPAALNAAKDAGSLRAANLPVGQAVRVTLLSTPEVKFPLRPEKPGGSVSYGGLIAVDIAQAGTYRVALGSGAWIDMVKQGKAVASVAHGHGPDCSGVRKMVDFVLTPGRYTLQLGANADAQITVLVARLP
jgi:hypothetical protein